MSQTTENLIKGVIAVAVLAIVIAILIIFWEPLTEWIKGDTLPEETEKISQENFDTLMTNIEKCQSIEDKDCVCDGFVNFPGVFKSSKLEMIADGKDMLFNVVYNKRVYASKKLSDIFVSIIFIEPTGMNFEKAREIDLYAKRWIDFTKNPPLFDNEELGKKVLWWRTTAAEPAVVSPSIYKTDTMLNFIVSYNKPEEINNVLSSLRKCGIK